MNEQLITVLMPLKNYHLAHLKAALATVFNQTCPDWRLLIIVERADLSFFKKLLEEELKDCRVEMIVNTGRKLAGAFNTGMKNARTQYTAILLADDAWSLDAVEVLTNAIHEQPDIDFFHTARMIIDENGESLSSSYPARTQFKLEDFIWTSPVKHLLCWKKDMALSFGGMDESNNCVGPDDYDFPWLMAERGASFQALQNCLYLYRDHFDAYRLTTHLPSSVHVSELTRILRKHGVAEYLIAERVKSAKGDYLKQCVYSTKLDKFVKDAVGVVPTRVWQEKYK